MKILAVALIAVSAFAQPAVFPGAVVTDTQLGIAKNITRAQLSNQVGLTDTTFNVTNSSCVVNGYAAPCATAFVPNMFVVLDNEAVIICGVVPGSVTTALKLGSSSCPNIDGRGWDGTVIATHNAAIISSIQIAKNHNQLAKEVEALEQSAIGLHVLTGADPTGVAYSTAAFNAAGLACATATKGGSIYIPPGLYKVSNATLYGNCTYWTSTQGLLSTVLKPGDGTSAVFSSVIRQAGNSVDSVVLDGITFQGFTFATSNSNQGLNLSGAADIKLKNVTSNNMYRLITCADCFDISIQDLDIWQQGSIWLGGVSGLTRGITLQNINAIAVSDWSGTNSEPVVHIAGASGVVMDNVNSGNLLPVTKDMIDITGICEGFTIVNSSYLGGNIGYKLTGSAFGQIVNSGGDLAATGGILLTGTSNVSITGGTITESSSCRVTEAPCTYQYGVRITGGNIRPSVRGMTIEGSFFGMQRGIGIDLADGSGGAAIQNNIIHMDSRVGQTTAINISSTEVSPTVSGNTIGDPSRYAVPSITQGASTVINMGTNGNLDPTTLTDFRIRTGSIIRLAGGTGALGTALNDGPGNQFTVTAQTADGFTIAVNTTALGGTAPNFTFFSNNNILDNVPFNSFKFISGNSVNNSFGYDSALVNKIPYSADVGTADTIYPTGELFKINGNTPTVNTIYAPPGYYGCITTLPVQAFSWGTGGNIQKTGTAVPGIAIRWCLDGAKWWASQ